MGCVIYGSRQWFQQLDPQATFAGWTNRGLVVLRYSSMTFLVKAIGGSAEAPTVMRVEKSDLPVTQTNPAPRC